MEPHSQASSLLRRPPRDTVEIVNQDRYRGLRRSRGGPRRRSQAECRGFNPVSRSTFFLLASPRSTPSCAGAVRPGAREPLDAGVPEATAASLAPRSPMSGPRPGGHRRRDLLELRHRQRARRKVLHRVRHPAGRPLPRVRHHQPAGARFCSACATPLVPGALRAAPLPAPEPETERRLVSVLFADLVGFTPYAAERDAEEVRARPLTRLLRPRG